MIFSVDQETKKLEQLPEEEFSELEILEREDLQEWVIEEPRILGENLLVISSEYGEFEGLRERLDILALDQEGKLVVVELKRDQADQTTDLQAIKYASYCATLTADQIQQDYQTFRNGRKEDSLSAKDVGDKFLKFLNENVPEEVPQTEEGWANFELDEKPRILLAAGSFGTEVTAPVMWLMDEYGVEFTCTRIEAYEHSDKVLLNSQQIIPIPEAEEYMTKRREKQEKQRKKSRRPAAINVLLDRGILQPGEDVYFDPESVPIDSPREWAKDDDFWWATITGDTGQSDNVRWKHDGRVYSFTGLTKELLHELIGRDRDDALNGYKFWCHPEFEGRTLSDLRNSDLDGDDRKSEETKPPELRS